MFRSRLFIDRGANVDGYSARLCPTGFSPGFRADLSRARRISSPYAYGVTGSREDAEDILQALFLRLMSRDFPPDFEKNPKGYLYRAAVNRSLNVIEARRRPQLLDAAVMDVPMSPEDPDFNQEMHLRLYQAVTKLRPEDAEILPLRYVHDASDAEIAKMRGVSRTLIAVRLFRLRARLKKLIRKSLGEKA